MNIFSSQSSHQLSDILQFRAANQPDDIAYHFLQDGKQISDSLTYGQLDLKAKAIAFSLQQAKLSVGERVLLLYPQGLEFLTAFFGCLYAGVIAIPAPAPDAIHLKRSLPRLQAIANDTQISMILITSRLSTHFAEIRSECPELVDKPYLITETIDHQLGNNWLSENMTIPKIAYLQYTSGSTASPKGVIITHENLMTNLKDMSKAFAYTSESKAVWWMPHNHDGGLIQGLLQPLFTGIICYIMSPLSFMKRPIRWLKAIEEYKITHSGAPNFAYDYCVNNITTAQRENLDLSNWQVAIVGAEPIQYSTIQRFTDAFAVSGFNPTAFYSGYALAETTLFVTVKPQQTALNFCQLDIQALTADIVKPTTEKTSSQIIVSSGKVIGENKIIIVNPETSSICVEKEIGEIWVSGKSVAQGYWQKPKATEDTFTNQLNDYPDSYFLRTGDLGFFHEQELFVTGRIKDLIIIRGQNYYPQDIEFTAKQVHSALQSGDGAAFEIEVESKQKLILIQEIDLRKSQDLDLATITGDIIQQITSQYQIKLDTIVFIKRGRLPKTTSGKVMRHLSRQKYREKSIDIIYSNAN